MFEKIFSLFSKINSALGAASDMQNTVDSVIYQKEALASAKSRRWYWLILVIILVIAVLYVFFG